MLRTLDVSASALVAQRQRMNTIAGNIANINTTRNERGELSPFQRRLVKFEAAPLEQPGKSRGDAAGPVGVRVEVDVDAATPPRRIYQPGHPDADAEGYISLPNIDLVTEFVNAVEANRAYEANVAAIDMTKSMLSQTLRILT